MGNPAARHGGSASDLAYKVSRGCQDAPLAKLERNRTFNGIFVSIAQTVMA